MTVLRVITSYALGLMNVFALEIQGLADRRYKCVGLDGLTRRW